ncbi:superoxide dismutase family protein [Longispora urticae]
MRHTAILSRAVAVAVGAAGALGLYTVGSTNPDQATERLWASATIRNADGAAVGRLTIVGRGRGVVTVQAHGLTPGFHGLHLHSTGICDPRTTDPNGNPAPFLSAGPHLGAGHHGQHAGDLPLLLVGQDGTGSAEVRTDRLTGGALFDADGTAVIVHAGPDNYANIPSRYSSGATPGPDAATLATGDSGGRFACGVLGRY